MKVKCSNCGEETEWEQEEDWQICEYYNGSGIDEVGNDCIICKGSRFVDINEDAIPICSECFFLEDYENEEY